MLVRERLTAGDSDRQVIDFLVARYGEFVLLRPRLSAHTVLLWLAPFAAIVAGAIGLLVFLRRRRAENRCGRRAGAVRGRAAAHRRTAGTAKAMMSPRLTGKSPRRQRAPGIHETALNH